MEGVMGSNPLSSTRVYTVEAAVADWLAEGLPGRAAKTVEVYADALRPGLAVIGRIPLRDLTVQDVRTALARWHRLHSCGRECAPLPSQTE
jgi:hypothetical protein